MAKIVGQNDVKETLVGGSDGDVIIGGSGHNILYGKGGADVFTLSKRLATTETSRDVVMDFTVGVDKIDVSAFGISSFEQLKLLILDPSAPFFLNAKYNGYSHSLELKGIRLADLAAADFIFSAPGAVVQGETKFNDVLFASNDGDTLNGGNGNDELFGGNGNDKLIGGTGGNALYGNGGADIFVMSDRQAKSAGESRDYIRDFKRGVDKIDVSALGVSGFEQLKLLIGGNANASSTSFDANYRGVTHSLMIEGISFKNLVATDFIFSGASAGLQAGTSYQDVLFGNGNGTLNGASGDDLLFGGTGNDTLNGGNGSDKLYGGTGNDILDGGNDSDELFGGEGKDILIGGYTSASVDRLSGEGGADIFRLSDRTSKGQHVDIVDFEEGIDKIDLSAYGISSLDQVTWLLEDYGDSFTLRADFGGYKNEVRVFDVFYSSLDASDFIFSKTGSVTNAGTKYNDVILGSAGTDTLGGDKGTDKLLGGAGKDVLVFDGGDEVAGGAGADIFRARPDVYADATKIMDFEIGIDKLDLSGWGVSSFDQVKLINYPDFTFNLSGPGFTILLLDLDGTKLTARDFVFEKTLNKTVIGTAGNDVQFGSAGADILKGRSGHDRLFGGAGNDILSGGEGSDILYGQAGADIFKLDQKISGHDEIGDFQVGVDRIDLSLSPVTSFDQLRHFLEENFYETGTDIVLKSVNYAQSLFLLNVDPTKLTAADFIFSKQDLAVQTATESGGQLFGGKGANTLIGSEGSDALFGGAGNDILSGGNGNNRLYGQAGADTFKLTTRVSGKASDDTIADFQVGVDKLDVSGFGITSFDQVKFIMGDGGAGAYFWARYGGASHSVLLENVLVSTLKASDFIFAAKPTLLNGSADADVLFGGASSETLKGGGDDDVLLGGAGNDTLVGGLGNDDFFGQGGADVFRLEAGLEWNPVTDRIRDFQSGLDRIDVSALGFSSLDQIKFLMGDTKSGVKFYGSSSTVWYEFIIEGVKLDQLKAADFIFDKKSAVVLTGDVDRNILIGSTSADKLSGGSGDDTLLGSDGNDKLYGNADDDYLYGGNGADALTGGTGADIFFYLNLSESGNTSATRDSILDFDGAGGDRIRLASIDANTKLASDQAFTFLGKGAFTGKAGELRYEKKTSDTYIYADVDGDKKADFSIHLDDAVTLSKGYFVL